MNRSTAYSLTYAVLAVAVAAAVAANAYGPLSRALTDAVVIGCVVLSLILDLTATRHKARDADLTGLLSTVAVAVAVGGGWVGDGTAGWVAPATIAAAVVTTISLARDLRRPARQEAPDAS